MKYKTFGLLLLSALISSTTTPVLAGDKNVGIYECNDTFLGYDQFNDRGSLHTRNEHESSKQGKASVGIKFFRGSAGFQKYSRELDQFGKTFDQSRRVAVTGMNCDSANMSHAQVESIRIRSDADKEIAKINGETMRDVTFMQTQGSNTNDVIGILSVLQQK